MISVADDGKLSDEFEEIHAGRRLVLEYPISLWMRIKAVVLDAVDTLESNFVMKCAAMLVPFGKELDWMYSSEGGQWQLVSSACVSRLILFSRICNTNSRLMETEPAGKSRGRRGPEMLKSKKNFCGTDGQEFRRHTAELWNRLIYLDQRGEPTGLTEREARQGRSYHARKRYLVEVEEKRKRKHRGDDFCQEKRREQHDDHRGRKSRRVDKQQQSDTLTNQTELPLGSGRNSEDEAMKHSLCPLVLALTPRICFNTGVPSIPFVNYTDNVMQRVVVEEALSTLTGLMRVEDVELETEYTDVEQVCGIRTAFGGLPQAELASKSTFKPSTRSWRRRLIFRRMPNLIQTEVLLNLLPPVGSSRRVPHEDMRSNNESQKVLKGGSNLRQFLSNPVNLEKAVREVDHSRLVHTYLPPIVAGFVLVAPCLDDFFVSHHRRARLLSIGVGGGALPSFLQKHFCFDIQVVDLDEAVLQLAKKHFGLKEDAYFQVTVGDGLTVVEEIAARAIQDGVVDERLKNSWKVCLGEGPVSAHRPDISDTPEAVELSSAPQQLERGHWWQKLHCQSIGNLHKPVDFVGQLLEDSSVMGPFHSLDKLLKQGILDSDQLEVSSSSNMPAFPCHQHCQSDPRVELIILDVDAGDVQLSLSSPPMPFLQKRFLLSARIALQNGGMLVMNVVPCGEKPYAGVIKSLTAMFVEVYEIAVEDDVNRIVFALPSPASLDHHLVNGHTVDQVKDVVGDRLVGRIRRLDMVL